MKGLVGLWLAALLAAGASGFAQADGNGAGPVLVELFTSQGCSSCPPADALAGELSRRDDVVVLSFHVAYWDYIGWKDPFATEQTTARQYRYADALRQRSVYTPQMVIGGARHVVGSDKPGVLRMIERLAKTGRDAPTISMGRIGDRLRVSLGAGHYQGDADVWLARFDGRHETDVTRGENRGQTVTNFHVVRDIELIGRWNGQPRQIMLDETRMTPSRGRDGCAVIVQSAGLGPVIAVAQFDMSSLGR